MQATLSCKLAVINAFFSWTKRARDGPCVVVVAKIEIGASQSPKLCVASS
jgi:hypothetical protein